MSNNNSLTMSAGSGIASSTISAAHVNPTISFHAAGSFTFQSSPEKVFEVKVAEGVSMAFDLTDDPCSVCGHTEESRPSISFRHMDSKEDHWESCPNCFNKSMRFMEVYSNAVGTMQNAVDKMLEHVDDDVADEVRRDMISVENYMWKNLLEAK